MDDGARPAAWLTVLAGPSGVGGGGVVGMVRARTPWVWVSVPVTTRPIRDHEVDGEDRRFVDRAEFERMIVGGQLLEWAECGGHLFGTPAEPIRARLDLGRPVLLKIDLSGARQVRAAMPGARLVFLAPPGTHCHADVEREFDTTVVNDCVERATDQLVGLLGCSFLTPARPHASG
ncbi:guanylate kinase [Micromonospora sonneratiae]|jgi:guanylate kinase